MIINNITQWLTKYTSLNTEKFVCMGSAMFVQNHALGVLSWFPTTPNFKHLIVDVDDFSHILANKFGHAVCT